MTLEADIPKICCIEGCGSQSKKKGLSKLGFPLYKKYCRKHDVNAYMHKYRMFKKDKCECCGFVPVHSCQLDVDHIDGNKQNNKIDNLKTLCANCHRLKTHINQDYKKRQPN